MVALVVKRGENKSQKIQELSSKLARKYILRRDTNYKRKNGEVWSTHGFQVRIPWDGLLIQKWFPDSQYGDDGFATARAWRDRKLKEIGKPLSPTTVIQKIYNRHGVFGISERKYTYTKKGRTGVYNEHILCATLTFPGGKRKLVKRSIMNRDRQEVLDELSVIVSQHYKDVYGMDWKREVVKREEILKRNRKVNC